MTDRRDEQGTEGEGSEEVRRPRARRNLFTYPMTALGGGLISAGILAFFILLAIDLFGAGGDNPYRAIVTWIGIPLIVTIGGLLTAIGAVRQARLARKRGERIRFMLRIEPSDPRYMRNLWLFLGITAFLLVLMAYSGIRAYEATESVGFCGETCHDVMGPQNTTYLASAHARVPCVECHIGPGRSFWIKSKIDGLRQVWKTFTNSYERPIATPVTALRPAQETCEECHWPEQFYGQQLVNRYYYRTDEANSPWTISLLVNVGGGNPRTARPEGIHWHMISDNQIEYVALDEQYQQIPWVRLTAEDGTVTVYADPDGPIDLSDDEIEIRGFDCIDCHNRPSHSFQPPATAINLDISRERISQDLPFIRLIGLELLNAVYETREEAHAAIPAGLLEFYQAEYPADLDGLQPSGHLRLQLLPRDEDGLPGAGQQPEPLHQRRVLPLPLVRSHLAGGRYHLQRVRQLPLDRGTGTICRLERTRIRSGRSGVPAPGGHRGRLGPHQVHPVPHTEPGVLSNLSDTSTPWAAVSPTAAIPRPVCVGLPESVLRGAPTAHSAPLRASQGASHRRAERCLLDSCSGIAPTQPKLPRAGTPATRLEPSN